MRRTIELAARGRGSTSPNPCVGAVLARGTATLGEGFHRRKGEAHAEVEAIESARRERNDVRGATLYASLEPCAHRGAVGPCTDAVLAAGIARVVIGTPDPNAVAAGGAARLRDAGIAVEIADDPRAVLLIEDFAVATNADRPYLRLKMASSLDGYVAAAPGSSWLTGEEAREFVRELRASYDAVMVGAGTVRVDDPQLTVRPPRSRQRPYVRVVACEEQPVPLDRRIFADVDGYARTIVLAPAGSREKFRALEAIADVAYAGDDDAAQLDLRAALETLKERGISSVLCEGGPTLAARLLEAGLVDRLDWIVAPIVLASDHALPALARKANLAASVAPFSFDTVERLGDDVLFSARISKGAACSPA
ncbi:MAG: bifunctional diaminohydroxyphosphoribosylaminopyrimidine deaminase/5-amino-6-(5-phosphoribosylamino)uracil reductase RibD [Candidatus Eremiobacteraeota bacterium]|nr:bifunctional diaminohydroxyphosphoribosylaminopyrimidine deaminase/5-amino-6-(5-phosphoribosylamino)uracil reductase RibD [Candidatus Eremiobacteraeota bacterium]